MMYAFTTEGYLLCSDPTTTQEFFHAMGNASLQMMMQFVNGQPTEELKEQARGEVYDLFNQTASAVLEALIPDNLRPDLTAQAILEKENEILDAQVPTTATFQEQMHALAQDIHKEMVKDGVIVPAKIDKDNNIIPLNRKERRKL